MDSMIDGVGILCGTLTGCALHQTSTAPVTSTQVITVTPTVRVEPTQAAVEPKTLDAATAAAQELATRFSAGDYAVSGR